MPSSTSKAKAKGQKVRECAGSLISTPVSRLRSRPLPMPFLQASAASALTTSPIGPAGEYCTHACGDTGSCRIHPPEVANLRYGDLFNVVRGKSEVALEDQS